jgi:flavin reductase (DIM6/NTAB) family NADH-FMN oxidoreductase RutF
MPLSSAASLFERIERELWIVTAAFADRRGGLVATFIAPASIVPEMPRVLAGIGKRHDTWALIEGSGAFGLHLVDESQVELIWRFGLQSGRDADKFAGLKTTTALTGSPILVEAAAWLDCRIENRMNTGDRTLYLAEVVDGDQRSDRQPLTLQRLLEIAPADKRSTMRNQLTADAALDAADIRTWRSRSGATP